MSDVDRDAHDALAARVDRIEVWLWGEKRRPMKLAEMRAGRLWVDDELARELVMHSVVAGARPSPTVAAAPASLRSAPAGDLLSDEVRRRDVSQPESEGIARLVHPYPLVAWRGTLPVDDKGRVAIFLNTPTGVARYSLDGTSARHLAESVLDYLTRSQSERFSESPILDVSNPPDGPNV